MSLRHLATLQLDRDTVADSHNFLVGYAEMCVRESGDLPPGEHPRDRQRAWARRVEAATSYFEAGQWAMITNPEEAVRLWGDAGRLYRELDFGFGYYLWVTTLGVLPRIGRASGTSPSPTGCSVGSATLSRRMGDRLSCPNRCGTRSSRRT